MSFISNTLAPTSSIVSGANQQGSAAKDVQVSQSNSSALVEKGGVANSSAAVISLSAESKDRAASSGQFKSVDPSFEEQESKSQEKKAKEERQSINIVA